MGLMYQFTSVVTRILYIGTTEWPALTRSPAFQRNPSLVVIDADASPGALAVPELPLCAPENDRRLAQIHSHPTTRRRRVHLS